MAAVGHLVGINLLCGETRDEARILENFGVAAVYNVIAIPLAFSGIATPLMAAIAMSTSSIVVSVNALRTK